MSFLVKSLNKQNIVNCYFCNKSHIARECPDEIFMSPIFKKKIGNMMEYWFANNFNCPECNHDILTVIGNHTPSFDVVCNKCYQKFEVKSKCLSVSVLPNDIQLYHGSYINYIYKLNKGLNLIVIIYGVNRLNKDIIIKEVLYANNIALKNKNIINVLKKNDSNLSIIFIKNKAKIQKLVINTTNTILSFKKYFNLF
jgi:hypothetical protein